MWQHKLSDNTEHRPGKSSMKLSRSACVQDSIFQAKAPLRKGVHALATVQITSALVESAAVAVSVRQVDVPALTLRVEDIVATDIHTIIIRVELAKRELGAHLTRNSCRVLKVVALVVAGNTRVLVVVWVAVPHFEDSLLGERLTGLAQLALGPRDEEKMSDVPGSTLRDS